MLIQNGVSDSNIKTLLREQTRIFKRRDMLKSVKELKDLGFNPSKTTFAVALHAKTTVNNTLWKEKVDAFKKWGCSEEDSLEAFRKKPYCMLTSIEKNKFSDALLGQSVGLGCYGRCQNTLYFVIKFGKKDHSEGRCCAISSQQRFDR